MRVDDQVFFLLDEEEEENKLCYSCAHMLFVFHPLSYHVIENHALDEPQACCDAAKDDKIVEWYINVNNGLGHQYMVIIWSARRVPYFKKAIKLTV